MTERLPQHLRDSNAPDALALSGAPHQIQAGDVYPFPLPALRYNEAHRLIRRAMERGGEVLRTDSGFLWSDDSWFADASVSVTVAEGNTAVTAHVDRTREHATCLFATPLGGAAAGTLLAGQLGLFSLTLILAAIGLVIGIPFGFYLDRWSRNRWRRRVWDTVESLGVLTSDRPDSDGAIPGSPHSP